MSRGPDGCVMPLLQPRPSGKAGRGGHPIVAGGVFAPPHVLAEAIRRRELSSDLTMSNRPDQRGRILARKVATPSMEGPTSPHNNDRSQVTVKMGELQPLRHTTCPGTFSQAIWDCLLVMVVCTEPSWMPTTRRGLL